MAEKREFTVKMADGKEVKLTTRAPNNKEMQDAEFEYSKAFNKAIIAGIVPQSKLVSSMIESGIWSPEKDDEIEKQRTVVVEMEKKLADCKDEAEKQNIAKALMDERDKLYSMRQERNDLVSHSAEAKADDAQRNYLVSRVTELAGTDKPYWRTHNDFLNEADGGIVFRSVYEHMTFINGLESDFLEKLPENAVKQAEAPKEEPKPEDKK